MYSISDTLNSKTNMSNPKKDNMLHNVWNVFNGLWERVSRVPFSFITNTNYPLSVTVVHNEGIISPEFYKNLTSKKELLNNDNVYICNAQLKESLNIIESIHRDVHEKKSYVDRIFNEDAKDSIGFDYKCIDNENRDVKKCGEKESFMKENVVNNTTKFNYLLPLQSTDMGGQDELFKHIYSDTNVHKTHDKAIDNNCKHIHDSNIENNEQFSDYVTIDADNIFRNEDTTFSTSSSNIERPPSVPQTTKSNLLNMWEKFCSVTDRFCRIDSEESDLLTKRSCSPKQRKKLNTIAKGRGRGRAKSQLRRSGVSQTRHRKERTKHDLKLAIESDLKNWEELDMYDTNENNELENCSNFDEDTVDGLDSMQCSMKEAIHPATFTFADIQPKKTQKSRARRNVDQRMCKFSTKMRFIPECTNKANAFDQDIIDNGYDFRKNTFRPRLISESSIDSEDSYCIVFETGSEEIHDSDFEDTEDSDTDQISEDEDTCTDKEFLFPTPRVKFNLNPVVHVMVQWDYAYRAARKGPWEEMARDRERFKGRINCIERVLNPVLTVQHRTHIWQERFACIE
ncbi:protein phosphatase 1 regulatory subunit 15 [Megachile rotundata]|uniref:protein phosphatase 1 regulatory subunit 15 n=1 Tax=Megachile rotundata TaxID=143995 RepID=UPI000614C2CD|nr:PREDICTED: uncharacterized protein LOC100875700 [Megachile rotundata]XP_012152837.1 PREDICTED: uncharacterized protein LOC100875700 [Megachile rotundata]XP_012152845.1 PREDICTED: uncharacterized protein LOC100875700 [Megachile rotundata]XP_012152852.1 PREDICTED: uncharacterized protein LOC100875700 [Megachile rotundata]XP_012152859.1 PREDICTED: uncharacterized protein LOC100875700 [Megachile rotundata]XP_012152866.1 PREDICTED: uncharacterized protein LOC100875700 [Megachile rotundata]